MQRASRQLKSPAEYAEGIRRGDRILLSQAITLIESTRPEHQRLAQNILEAISNLGFGISDLSPNPKSLRVGITGSPGVGKSTFIDTLGSHLTGQGRKLAVLAVDPSSSVSRGSILADKTRMNRLAADPNAFIRPSPAGNSLGGVAARTREAMLLCEAAGFDTIFVETVGVGQSEVAVHGMVDFFLLLLLPGAGDELQGIKRGIVEMADLLVVNKADGDRQALAIEAKRAYARALHLFPPTPIAIGASGWSPKALTCSSLTGEGVAEIWRQILDFQKLVTENGWLEQHRREQSKQRLSELFEQGLRRLFLENEAVKTQWGELEKATLEGKISARRASQLLLDELRKRILKD